MSSAQGLIDDTTLVDSASINWQYTSYVSRLYGRGANCPILNTNFNLEFVKPKDNNTKWWEQIYTFDGTQYAVAVSSLATELCMLEFGNYAFMPRNKVGANTKFDASDTEYFSQLPSSLVQYTTSTGDIHYVDEGMWLGKMEYSGTVAFSVRFAKESGSGTQVKLHVSKKPFSHEYSESQLIETTAGGELTAKKEQLLNYNTTYLIKIAGIKRDDDLYLEWLPVNDSDLTQLQTFTNYTIDSES